MNKVNFLETLLDERTRFEHLVNRVHTSRLTISGVVGRWSVKDTLAHILVYEQFLTDRLAEIVRGEFHHPSLTQAELDVFLQKFSYPDFDSPLLDDDSANEWIVQKYKSIPLEDVVAQENQAFISIASATEAMQIEVLEKHNLFERVADHTYKHYQDHYDQINAWLEFVR